MCVNEGRSDLLAQGCGQAFGSPMQRQECVKPVAMPFL
jgi:hypothetical protein